MIQKVHYEEEEEDEPLPLANKLSLARVDELASKKKKLLTAGSCISCNISGDSGARRTKSAPMRKGRNRTSMVEDTKALDQRTRSLRAPTTSKTTMN